MRAEPARRRGTSEERTYVATRAQPHTTPRPTYGEREIVPSANIADLVALLGDRPVAYHPTLAKALGSVNAALLLSQLLYWTPRTKDPDGWVYKTQAEFYDETGLSRREQETARRALACHGVLIEARHGMPAQLFFQIDRSRLGKLLMAWMADSASQGCTNPPNMNGANRQTLNSDPESTSDPAAATAHAKGTEYEGAATAQVYQQAEHYLGVLSRLVADNIGEDLDTFGALWVLEAMKRAANAGKQTWNYVHAMLVDWERAGQRKDAAPPEGAPWRDHHVKKGADHAALPGVTF